jgi:large subunit ribosomal protein L13
VDTLSYKTISANKSTVRKEWVLVDAKDEVLGRLASKVAFILRGKHKTSFTPHVDCGDNVVVINAEKVRMTGRKMSDRELFSHTGYPGGQKRVSPAEMLAKNPTSLITNAVKGMLPKNRLGSEIMRNLHVYAGETHPHEAQQVKKINLNDIKE